VVDSLGWAVAILAALAAAVGRCVSAKRRRRSGPPTAPPPQVATAHAIDAIETAAQGNLDTIADALEGDDPAGDVADLANRRKR
jgi:hypothetical protein